MSVYVDPSLHHYGRMIMCHMWADTLGELLEMADKIGIERRHLRGPPKTSWTHFDVCKRKRALALRAGAVETDCYGPVYHVAKLGNNEECIRRIERLRERIRKARG